MTGCKGRNFVKASLKIGFAADELPVHYRGGVGKSEKRRVGGGGEVGELEISIYLGVDQCQSKFMFF